MARNRQITPRRGVNLASFLPLRFFDDKMTRNQPQISTKQPANGSKPPENDQNEAKITQKRAEIRSEGRVPPGGSSRK